MSRETWAVTLAGALIVFALFGPAASIISREAVTPAIDSVSNAGRDYFTNTILLDQDGAPHRLYSDLIAGRIVIITFVFTGCRSSCPLTMAKLVELQDLLGDDTNRINILSISVDPVIDTPKALRAYADEFHPRPGWFFLTGQSDAVSFILRRLGNRSATPEEHTDVIVIGNDAFGTWVKLTAIATTEDLAAAVAEVSKMPAN
jgi:protein SCO1